MSTKLTACKVCETPREPTSLINGVCPFCSDHEAAPASQPATKPAPKTPKARKEPIKVEPAPEPVEAQPGESYEPPKFNVASAEANPLAELAARELARRRFLHFVKRFRPKYLAGWVHEDICRRLERFLAAVERGEEPRMLLMMPPRSGKSELGSRHFPAWVLGKHPDWEIIAASHTASLTLSFSRYIRDIMRDPAFKVLFPDCHLDPASQSTENWNLLNGGGYLAAGVGTGITGRGAHILLLDDLVKDENEATSATITDGTWSWYSSTAYTRLAPGGGVLGIMTWWSESDWAGRIQEVMASGEGDKFEIVRYPAINEEGDEYLLPDDTIVEIMPGAAVPEGARMTRPKGTAIHPERYSTKAMQRIKNNLFAAGEQWVWNALYQQNPVPDDGTFFTKDMFRYYGMAPSRDELYVYQAWDFAITEGQGKDYTVGVTIGQDHRGNLYVLDVVRFQSGDSYIIIDEILNFAEKWRPELLGFEDGQIWKALSAVFEKACEERRYYPSTELLKPLTDKKVRASPLRGLMQRGKVYFDKEAEWFQPLVKEFTRFMSGGKHDDIVDATSWCARLTLTRAAPKQRVDKPKEKSWKDRMHLFTEDAGGSHMSA